MATLITQGDRLVMADLVLDLDQRRLYRNDAEIKLSKLNYAMLRALLHAAPGMLGKDDLADDVWGGRFVSPETVAQRVKLLRRALDDDALNPRYIQVVRGQGYRWMTDVQAVVARSTPASTFLGNKDAAAGLGLERPNKPSVAVLPFDTLGDDNVEHRIFADGVTHDLITCLGRTRGLFVSGRGSSFMFRGSGHPAAEVGEKLGVRYIVQGCILFSGGRIRVNAALADADSGNEIWAEVLRGKAGDVFDIQDEIAEAVAASVEDEIDLAEQRASSLRRPEDLDAWAAYHRGWWHLNQFAADSIGEGERFFRRSIELEPESARAWAGLSCVYWLKAFLEVSGDRNGDINQALEHAGKSVSLDRRDPLAHWALGRALHLAERLEQAAESFEISNQLNPNFSFGKFAHAFVLMLLGQNAASNEVIDSARRLSPFDPMSYAMLGVQATNLALLDELDNAASISVRGAGLQAWKCQMFPVIAAVCNLLAGNEEVARQHYERLLNDRPDYDAQDYFRAFPHQSANNIATLQGAFDSLRRFH